LNVALAIKTSEWNSLQINLKSNEFSSNAYEFGIAVLSESDAPSSTY
jgi:hypothetical protein